MGMEKPHLVVIGNPRRMPELTDNSVQLIVTNPPYFDMGGCGECAGTVDDFNDYLKDMQLAFFECHRVLEDGGIICVNVCDVVNYRCKCSLPVHYALLLQRAGFEYRDDLIWRKPAGSEAGLQTGIFIQHSSPLSYSPSNILGHVLVLRKGNFTRKAPGRAERQQAMFEIRAIMRLRSQDRGVLQPSLYPRELAETLIELYSHKGETVLDPFLGSGTTAKAAATLDRRSIGYQPDRSRLPSITKGSRIAPEGVRIIEQRRLFE
ncbi:MAG: site-specific DNA-methyltransferase [Candidatus Micrarchaeota archaeon]|nr:site-specific DNA-methyltransferase [Candidatus Micrarchaeota archaeon]